MDTNLDTNQLLQAILEELRAAKQPLGFGHPPKARTIYANRQYLSCLWYFSNGAKNEPEPIECHALTGMIERLEIEQKEYKGKLDPKVNLHVRAERRYVIQAGLETQFARGCCICSRCCPFRLWLSPSRSRWSQERRNKCYFAASTIQKRARRFMLLIQKTPIGRR